MTIVLLRHAETDLAGKFCGHSDPGLNAAGEHQLASIVAKVFPLGISRIYSSDLRRASQTAAAISRRIGVDVELRPGLREIGFGPWEGLTWNEIQLRHPDEAQSWLSRFPVYAPPGGEPYAHFTRRVDTEFELLLRNVNERHTFTVVTHRGVMQYALTHLFGFSAIDAWEKTAQYGSAIVLSSPRNPADCKYAVYRGPDGLYTTKAARDDWREEGL